MSHRNTRLGPAYNLRGAVFMVLSMAGFAVEDSLLKIAAVSLPPGQVLITFGILGTATFALLSLLAGEPPLTRAMLGRAMVLRSLSEVTGRLFYMLAIALTPLSTASAILQATPLVVMVGAALLFGERIGPRRWLAVAFGFGGVLLILRPGTEGFGVLSLLAIMAMLGFAGRDLATRAAPVSLSFRQLGVAGFSMLIVAGLIVLPFGGPMTTPDAPTWLALLAASAMGVCAYTFLTVAMRTGQVGAVTPFRYTRLIFAMVAGIALFGESPDRWTIIASIVIILAGIAALRLSRQRQAVQPA
ncbi:DMT family transporter [Paracoccus benzoatiresistens]|uniref:DMT family transporter n=1 Tax=Paracoccus benzoatiresistens TaxID=2997341 RepID=A0ABT4J7F1_9RHOB|nr:DMT family transporter [Paracoccus sp. EF6]MCZ0963055.1 DMT family transporter [Paracoccus sp. EF6]